MLRAIARPAGGVAGARETGVRGASKIDRSGSRWPTDTRRRRPSRRCCRSSRPCRPSPSRQPRRPSPSRQPRRHRPRHASHPARPRRASHPARPRRASHATRPRRASHPARPRRQARAIPPVPVAPAIPPVLPVPSHSARPVAPAIPPVPVAPAHPARPRRASHSARPRRAGLAADPAWPVSLPSPSTIDPPVPPVSTSGVITASTGAGGLLTSAPSRPLVWAGQLSPHEAARRASAEKALARKPNRTAER